MFNTALPTIGEMTSRKSFFRGEPVEAVGLGVMMEYNGAVTMYGIPHFGTYD